MASEHKANIRWRIDGDFASGKYSRVHEWAFDGGETVHASPSPGLVPVPLADASGVDPEEAFAAALASCHMLWFLNFARKAGYRAVSYDDSAVALMEKGADGKVWIPKVTLNISVTWDGDAPDRAALLALHDQSHAVCTIANSVRSEVVCNIVEA